MKERPILFSAPMVRAILEGRKTMTRRVIKPQPNAPEFFGWCSEPDDKRYGQVSFGENCLIKSWAKNPYGDIGDRLRVRETWRVGAWNEADGEIAVDYKADGYCRREWLKVPEDEFEKYWIQSTDDAAKALGQQDNYKWRPESSPCRWRPSIFMPRWASRILLEITSVRVDRLQNISEDDALAEGLEIFRTQKTPFTLYKIPGYPPIAIPGVAFGSLWDSINSKRGFGWDANPWVWVVSFKRIEASA